MESEQFEKTPQKAARWFRAFIVLSLLYGITFSLTSFFNWIFFWAAIYSFFMSYFLLPVQPKIFQGRPKQARGPIFNTGTRSAEGAPVTPGERGKKFVKIVVAVMGALFMIPFVIGFIDGWNGDDQTTSDPQEQTSTFDATDSSPASLVERGNGFFNNQQYDSADVYYDLALASDDGYGEAIYGKGIVAYQQGRSDEANTYFIRSYEGGFRYAWLSWVLADMYDKQGQTSRAADLYKESVKLDSTYTDSYKRLAELEPGLRDKYLELARKYGNN